MSLSIGVDLGKDRDSATLAIVEGKRARYGPGLLALVHLERYPLGTSYTAVVDRVVEVYRFAGETGKARGEPVGMAVDVTGVGGAVSDMLVERGVRFDALKITGGKAAHPYAKSALRTEWKVPKGKLVAALEEPMRNKRFSIARELSLRRALEDELRKFRRKINKRSGHVSYEHATSRDHDDLVLACALACWGAAL